MKTSLLILGLVTLTGGAVAAPFNVAGARLRATGNFATPDVLPGTPASAVLAASGEGVFWDSPLLPATNAGVRASNLFGAHPSAFPSTVDTATAPESAGGIAIVPPTADDFSGPGDTSFDVGWFIPDIDDRVRSDNDAFVGNTVWLARLSGTDISVVELNVTFSIDINTAVDFVVDGPGSSVPGGNLLFAKSVPVPGVPNAFDIILGDLIIPSPGAGALLAVAGLGVTRRRR